MILYISSCTYPPTLNITYYDFSIDSLLPAPPGKAKSNKLVCSIPSVKQPP